MSTYDSTVIYCPESYKCRSCAQHRARHAKKPPSQAASIIAAITAIQVGQHIDFPANAAPHALLVNCTARARKLVGIQFRCSWMPELQLTRVSIPSGGEAVWHTLPSGRVVRMADK